MKKIVILGGLMALVPAMVFGMETILTPSISVRSEYTDNVDRVNDDPENGTEPEYDFITSISPSIALDLVGKTTNVTLSYQPSRVYYERTEDHDYWRHSASLGLNSQLARRVTLSVGGSYLQSEDEADTENPDDTIDTDYTRRKERFTFRSYNASTGLNYQFGERDRIGLNFGYGGTENDDPTLDDSRYYQPSLSLAYWFTPRWGAELFGDYEKGEFDPPEGEIISDDFERYSGSARFLYQFNRQLTGNVEYSFTQTLNDDEAEDDERIHDFSGGITYLIDQDISLSLQVGYSILEVDDDDDESDMSGSLDFIKTFRRGSIGINASSGYEYSYYDAENLGLNYYIGAGLSASYQIWRRVSANAHADYRYSEYKDETPQREDDKVTAGCGLSFQLLQWLFADAGYTYSLMDSNDDENDYTENRVYVGLRATLAQPLRWSN